MSNKRTTNERRGVAPIIATLLMVAIAVVGGILIFVFAQGFFNTTSVTGPTVESIQLVGHDFRDVLGNSTALRGLDDKVGTGITGVGSATTTDNRLSSGDWVVFYALNTGNTDVVVADLKIAGKSYTFSSTTLSGAGAAVPHTTPAEGSYVILTAVDTTSGVGTVSATSVIPAGQEVTFAVNLGGTGFDLLKVGRTASISVVTGNGATFSDSVVIGTSS